ncbi:MAG: hypothetical protein GKC03_01495 [Methanomassiliicoccales archaeon]|nr:hypothetical protein [Methanomassiliicoccales archaeon]NYT14379.1 hypothetical protein [Methanomassiliicoccales archaeon]
MNLTKILTFLVVFSMFSVLGVAFLSNTSVAADTTVEVNIIGKTGTETLSLSELQAMTAVSGKSMYEKSVGWGGEGNYTGVLVSDLVELVGGMEPGDTITVTSSDDWNTTYSYNNVYDIWPDPSTQGDMILAYEFEGDLVPTWTSGLLIAFLPDDEIYDNNDSAATTTLDEVASSASKRWAKYVQTITVNTANWNVTLTNDSWSIVYSDLMIRNMTAYTANGSFEKSSGTIEGPFTYTGVNVTYLLEAVGGISEGQGMLVKSRDGYYNLTYTYDQILWNDSVEMVLAYDMNGVPMDEDEVPRIVLIGEDDPLTDGHLWAKMVSSMTILQGVVDYQLNLTGAFRMEMDRATFDSGAACHNEVYGNYSGIPLWRLCGYVDDPESIGAHEYATGLNYTITVYAADGFNKTLTFDEVDENDDIIVANMFDEEPLTDMYPPLKLEGDLPSKSFKIKGVSDIVLNWVVDIEAEASESEIAVGDSVEISATISDQTPIGGQNITFWIGDDKIGEATTNASGVASIEYVPSVAGSYTVECLFTFGYTVNSANASFDAIIPPTITVTSPDGGENWVKGDIHNITWNSTGDVENVKIELYKDGSLNTTISATTANDGSFSWNISEGQATGEDFKIKIVAIDDPEVFGMSSANFEISEAGGDGGLSIEIMAIIIIVIVVIVIAAVVLLMRK